MKTHAQSLADALRKALVPCQPDYLKHPDQHATLLREIHAEAWTALNAFEKAEPATQPTPSSDPSEESLKVAGTPKMDAAFNASYYTPAIRLLAIFSAGCELERECQSLRAQAAMAGELADALKYYADKNHFHQVNDPFLDDQTHRFAPAGAVVEHGDKAREALARFSATKSIKEATSGDPTAEEMLDWLEKNGPRIRYAIGLGKDKDEWVWHDHRGDYHFQPTVRQAIAAAMRGSKEAT